MGPCGKPSGRPDPRGYGAAMRSDPAAPPRFLTLQQVADELNVSRAQVYALVRDRSVLAVKIGGRGQWRVERVRLEEYIQRLYAEAGDRKPGDLPDEPDGGDDDAD